MKAPNFYGYRTMKRYLTLLTCFAALLPMFLTTVSAEEPEVKPLRVLIIDDHRPGYYNMPTATILRDILRQDKQLEVTLVEDAEVLGTDLSFDYDVIVLHFKNYLAPKRAEAMKSNLDKFVTEGGGLFVFHFACGAFEDWKGFEKLAGRVWEPKKRPHDPYGLFNVQIIDTTHPITQGLKNFEIDDELYTCLRDSDVPIHVLAESVSKVDSKLYPMAFVLNKGKGRVFHSTLGHDEKSLSSPEFQTMCIRAVVWCANRE